MKLRPLSKLFLFENLQPLRKKEILDALTSTEYAKTYSVQKEEILEQINVIQRRFKYVSKNLVIDELEKGNIIPVFNETSKIPVFIPPWLIQEGNTIKSVVDISGYSKKDGDYQNISNKHLFALLQNALVINKLFYNENKILMNVTITKALTKIYTRMVLRVFDRLYSLNLDPLRADQCAYMVGKFFQIYLMGKTDNETTRAIAFDCCKNETPRFVIDKIESEFSINYESFPDFLTDISDNVSKISLLTIRKFIETWSGMYGETTMFASESFHCFLCSIFSANVSAGINNESVINSLAAKNIQDAYLEFFRLIK